MPGKGEVYKMDRGDLIKQIESYCPYNEQEEADRQMILKCLKEEEDIFDRGNCLAHMTASAWVVNPGRTKVLMVYHNIYKSWSWLGGHADNEQDLLQVAVREVKEETGLTLTSWRFRGLVTFRSTRGPVEDMEYMCLYTADGFEGEMADCNEGTLEWVKKEAVCGLNIWEGDKIFFRLLNENAPFFSLKLTYEGDRLIEAVLDGKALIA